MIFRNSILSIIRSFGKTALFTLLIFSLTLALALSVSVWASVEQFLEDCEDFYTTIGLIEYMGTDYPDDTVYDAAMDTALMSLDTSAMVNDDATFLWEEPSRSFGYIDGFWRTDSNVPSSGLSVLVVGKTTYKESNNYYSAVVINSLYSTMSRKDTILYVDDDFGTLETGHYYLLFGEVYFGRSPLLRIRPATYDNAIVSTNGIEIPNIIDITSEGMDGFHYEIPEDSILLQVAKTLPVTNNSVLVSSTDDLMSLLPFHQEELYIVEGRAFTEEEYANGSHVIVISQLMAARLGISVGDAIDLSVAVSDIPGVYNSYWVEDGFSSNGQFTVVGIMNTVMDKSWYVYVPKSVGLPESQFPIGYTVGRAVIQNDEAAAFLNRIDSTLDDRFQLTIYDQGYSTVAIPYQTILVVAQIVTAVCSLVEFAVLLLFGFLFVYRQRETSETMLMLGSGRVRVLGYFLFSSGLISLLAASAGAVAGYWLHDGIIELVAKSAENFKLIDTRFSNGNLTISRTLEFAPELDWQLFIIVGVIVFLLAVLSCLAFTVATFINSRPSQRKSFGPRKERKTSHLRGGLLKYAILSILRGGSRTLVVPILAVSVVIFFGDLATTSIRYQDQLEAIYDNTTIEGYYTDIHGKQIGNQVLNAHDVASLFHSGQLNTLSISIGEPYYYLGINRFADGTEQDISPLYKPRSSYVYASLKTTISRCPDLTATNNIRKSPEFFYADSIFLTFLDGYNESILTVPSDHEDVNSCIIPTSLMAEKGIGLGDTIRVAIDLLERDPETNDLIFFQFEMRVVGSYEKQGTADTIYVPLSLFFDTSMIWDEGWAIEGPPSETFDNGFAFTQEQTEILLSMTLNSATFTLSDSHDLLDFKEYLTDYGYSQVQKVSDVREFIVLKDAAFNNSIASVKQQIHYVNTLYPFLYVLVGIIAISVSYLLVVSRKNEFATMRGLGAPRIRSFFSFFFEQSFLCILGISIGFLIWVPIMSEPTPLHMMLVAGFIICYFTGSIISITIMNQANVLTILSNRE
jgi:ABC-type lipoprotein release transport system permease subunit